MISYRRYNQNQQQKIEKNPLLLRYTVADIIGKGAHGVVLTGMNISTNEKVAIKAIKKPSQLNLIDFMRIQNQIRILNIARHPNIVQFYEMIHSPTEIYIIMEYLENGTLLDNLRKNKKLNELQARKILGDIISAVEYLHELNIAHLDLKLENIMLDCNNNIKIIDFSLAKFYSANQKIQIYCGTEHYAAPEIFKKIAYCPQLADIWSCGVILFILCCGYFPFSCGQQIIKGQFVLKSHLSQDLKDFLSKILIVDPNKRYGLSEIKNHKWWKQLAPEECSNSREINQIDEEILEQIWIILRKKLKQDIQNQIINEQTVMYSILLNKKRKEIGLNKILEHYQKEFRSKKLQKIIAQEEIEYQNKLEWEIQKIINQESQQDQLYKQNFQIQENKLSGQLKQKIIQIQYKQQHINQFLQSHQNLQTKVPTINKQCLINDDNNSSHRQKLNQIVQRLKLKIKKNNPNLQQKDINLQNNKIRYKNNTSIIKNNVQKIKQNLVITKQKANTIVAQIQSIQRILKSVSIQKNLMYKQLMRYSQQYIEVQEQIQYNMKCLLQNERRIKRIRQKHETGYKQRHYFYQQLVLECMNKKHRNKNIATYKFVYPE